MDSKDGSPYIHNFDLVPPSPLSRPQDLGLESSFNVNTHHQYDPHGEGALTSPPYFDPSGTIENSFDLEIEADNSNPNSHLGSGHNSPQFLPHGSPHLQQQFHSQHTSHNHSYTNSYLNSPYSQHSELSFTGDDLNFELLSDMVGGIGGQGANPRRRYNDGEETGAGVTNDAEYDSYDPSDYDGPSPSSVPATSPPPMGMMGMSGDVPSSSLLMFTHADADYVSPHFSSGQGQGHNLTQQHLQQHTFNQGSPSSNGDAGDNNNNGFSATADRTATRHSRASSVASVNRVSYNPQQQQFGSPQPSPSPQPSFQQPLPGQSQPQSHPSPRTFDVARSLGNMSVHTPNWGTQPLPSLSLSQTHSPNIRQAANQPLPPVQQNMKPQSPPRLRMPEDMNFNGNNGEQRVEESLTNSLLMGTVVPKINAPDEDMNNGDESRNQGVNDAGPRNDGGLGAGPRFHIVPATPISGGAEGGGGVPFQQTLATLTQGSELGFGLQQSHTSPSAHSSAPPSTSVSPSTSPAPSPEPQSRQQNPSGSPYAPPVQLPTGPNSAGLAANGDNVANNTNRPGTRTINGFVFPDVASQSLGSASPGNSAGLGNEGLGLFGGNLGAPGQNQGLAGRGRSNSDAWGSFEYQQQQLQVQRLQAQQALQRQQAAQAQAQQQLQAQQMQTVSFGGNSNNHAGAISASSDTLGAPARGHRVSRSEDVRLPVLGAGFSQPQPQGSPYTQNQQLPQMGNAGYQPHHGQSNSMGGGLFMDYQQQQQQFLHPLGVGNAGANRNARSLSPGGEFRVGHFRRASSGSRSDRGAEVWGSQGVAPGHTHSGSTGSSLSVPRRVSPYPSPNASPRVRYEELQEDNSGFGIGNGLDMGNVGQGGLGMGMSGGTGGIGVGLGMSIGISSSGMSGGLPEIGEPPVSAGYSDDVPITGRGTYAASSGGRSRAESSASAEANTGAGNVAKQNVTTGRTANASIRRRKQDANFVCTFPGCNSTFTRGFNLKGHLRSHYEQKPYKCHWPGCGKGFARQHDCKRHEQLHSNYRPFECEGCRKQFARMDALNRHLRSEAGAECARVVEKSRENNGGATGHVKGDIGMEFDDPAGSGGTSGEDDEKPQVVTTRTGRQVTRRRTNMDDEYVTL